MFESKTMIMLHLVCFRTHYTGINQVIKSNKLVKLKRTLTLKSISGTRFY